LGGPAPKGNPPFDRSATFPCVEVDPEPVIAIRQLGLLRDDARRLAEGKGHPGVARHLAVRGDVLDLEARDLGCPFPEDQPKVLISRRFRRKIAGDQRAGTEDEEREELSSPDRTNRKR
jgi:hypothetical protein